MKRVVMLLTVIIFIMSACAKDLYAAEARRGGVVLALSGGGTKGIAHIGVLKVLEELDIPVVGIVGTSMGSIIGGLYATGLKADEIHKIVTDANIMGLLSDSSIARTDDVGDHVPASGLEGLLVSRHGKKFEPIGPRGLLPAVSLLGFLNQYTGGVSTSNFLDLPVPFACVAADIGTGDTVVLRSGSLASSIRASAAIPGLLEPVEINGRLLVDGGLVANLPVEIAKDLFPGYPVIAVNLSQSIRKDPSTLSNQANILLQMIDVMTIDNIRNNESMADVVLHPDLSEFSMLDTTGYDTIYERGVAIARAHISDIERLSASAPIPAPRGELASVDRIVRLINVSGLEGRQKDEIEKGYKGWIGTSFDPSMVKEITETVTKRANVYSVDVDVDQARSGKVGDVDLNIMITKQPPYEMELHGYSSSLHPHRWIGASIVARDLLSEGDSTLAYGRVGNNEWNVGTRYFTPMKNDGQWGFAIDIGREWNKLFGVDEYNINRQSGRLLRYFDTRYGRLGVGVGLQRTNGKTGSAFTAGPYLYFSKSNYDNAISPSRGFGLTSTVWWNSDGVWVSNSSITAYIPVSRQYIVANLGLKTGLGSTEQYPARLGSEEEMITLSRAPYFGDQAAWAHIGLGHDFYRSWWGTLRGEFFAAYGIVMNEWRRKMDAWEVGLALSVPGKLFNGRLIMAYGNEGEFNIGFSVGSPIKRDMTIP